MPGKKNSHYRTDSTIDQKEPEKLEPSVEYVVECWEKWDQHWSSKLSDFDKWYDQWIGTPPERDQAWQSQFNKMLSWQAEKALVSRFHSFLFPIAAPIDYDKVEMEDEFQGILGKSVVSHWFKVGRVSVEFLKAMRSAAVYGSGFFEDDWYLRKEKIFSVEEEEIPDFRNMVDESGEKVLDDEGNARVTKIGSRKEMRERSRLSVVEDRYRVRKANIYAWRIHPDKLSDDDDLPAIKQEFINFDDLLELQAESEKFGEGKFANMDKIKDDHYKVKEEDLARQRKDGDFDDKKYPKLEILHYWGRYSDDKDKEREPMWITVVNRKYKIRQMKNPYWHQKPPLFHINWTEDVKDSYYGIGVVQIGQSAEERANTVVNIRTDERKKNVKGGGWYNALDKKIKKTQVQQNIPGLWKQCSDVNTAVRPDPVIPSTPDDYKEEEIAVNDHRDITGATTALQAPSDESQQHDTLGGLKILIGEAAQRLKPDLVMMEINGIRKCANRAIILTRQFFSEPMMIELLASQDELAQFNVGKFYQLQPKEIIGKTQFHCTGLSEAIEKGQNIDKLVKYTEITSKVPPMQAITNYRAIGKQIALWLGLENVEDLVLMNQQAPLSPVQPGQPGQGGPNQGQGPGQLPGQGGAPQPQGQGGQLPPQAIQSIIQSMRQQ